jgi:hypothetical protein
MGVSVTVQLDGSADADLTAAPLVEVHERMGEPTTFRLRLSDDIEGGDLPWLTDGRLAPDREVTIVVEVNGDKQCLVKGPIHGQQARIAAGGAGSWMDVLGSDASVKMDREVKAAIWSGVAASDAASQIVAKYGFTPDVKSTDGRWDEDKHALVQRDTDFRFVRRLARRAGFLFWLTADASGTQTAHFKAPPTDGSPAAKLSLRSPSPPVVALDLSWDTERPTSTVGHQLDLNSKDVLDGGVAKSPVSSLGKSGLTDVATGTRSAHVTAPADDAGELSARGNGALTEAGWFLRGSLETSAQALGKIVRAHTIVEIDGAGTRHSGKYFVAGVRHLIDQTAHRMQVELVRNGWGA